MRLLIHFIMSHVSWVVFAIYTTLSCMLLFNHNPYHHHVWLSSAGSVASTVYDASNSVGSYLALRSINADLQRRNADLESEIIALRHNNAMLSQRLYADTLTTFEPLHDFSFIIADVINNSIARPFNYLTVDKGSSDGVKPEMGVVDQNGVVGVVNLVSENYARVISLLNPNFRLSCKIKGSDVFGSLVWDGVSPREALLEELPKHTVYASGDTIVTSGFSAVFPEGIPVGTVVSAARDVENDNFFTLRIRLLTDFSHLSTVRIISNRNAEEIHQLENEQSIEE